jgi:hypothetical protein
MPGTISSDFGESAAKYLSEERRIQENRRFLIKDRLLK